MSTNRSHPDTTCPDWCDQPNGEDFSIEIATREPTRCHEHVIERGDGFTVWITAVERITTTGKVLEPITVGLETRAHP
jgi:hypothetical protein